MDCIYFNEKPSISRKIEKGRRHKGYEKLKKHLSKDAYISKSILIDNNVGNREKNRLVCEASIDSISPNVSYSLNRKNRWNTITPLTLNINAITSLPNDMSVAVVEQMNTIPDIGCINEKTNKHFIEGCVTGITMSNEDRCITMKKANGPAGAQLSSLLGNNKNTDKTPDRENNDTDDLYYSSKGKAQVRYHINTAQKNTNYSIGVHYKRQLKAKLKEAKLKGAKLEDDDIEEGNLKENKKKGKTCRKLDKKFNFDVTELISDYEDISEDDEIYSMSRSVSPKFSLSDFVKESSPVIIDKGPIQNVDKSNSLNDSKIKPKELLTIPDEVREVTLFDEIKIKVSKWNNFNFDDVNKLIKEYCHSIKWIDENKTLFQVDFSKEFRKILGFHKQAKLMVFVRKIKKEENFLNVTFNGTFKFIDLFKHNSFKTYMTNAIFKTKKKDYSMEVFLNTCFSAVVEWFLDEGIKIKEVPIERSIVRSEYSRNYNFEELSKTVIPYDENEMREFLKDYLFKNLDKKSYNNENLDIDCNSKSDDDFEKIDFDDFDSVNKKDEIEFISEICYICNLLSVPNTSISLLECEHNFCFECITTTLYKQLRLGDTPLHCPICQSVISIDFLPILFPLPLISFYIHIQYTKEKEKEGLKNTNCLKCKNVVSYDSNINNYNIINCQRCNVFWCTLCKEPPHFPLTCQQNVDWKIKFNGEGEIVRNTENNDENKYKLQKFLKMAKRAHDIRFDDQKSNTIISFWRKKDFETSDKKTFLKYRKALLYFIEYGFGWLYVNKSHNQDEYSKIKTTLSESLSEIKSLDEAILNYDKGNFEMKVSKLKQNVDIIMDEFSKQIPLKH